MRYNSVNLGINMEWFYCRKCLETRLNGVFEHAGWLHNYDITQDSMHNDGGARGRLSKMSPNLSDCFLFAILETNATRGKIAFITSDFLLPQQASAYATASVGRRYTWERPTPHVAFGFSTAGERGFLWVKKAFFAMKWHVFSVYSI